MRICMITPTFLPKIGGAEYQVRWLVEELVKQRYQVSLIAPEYSKRFINNSCINDKLLGCYYLRITDKKSSYKHFINIKYIYTYIKQTQPDLIHIHFLYPWGVYLYLLNKFKLINIPIVVTSHGIDLIRNKDLKDYYQNSKLRSAIIKEVARNVDKIVLVSKYMWNDAVKSGVPEDKLCVIHNGYKIEKYSKSELEKKVNEIKAKYSISEDELVITALGRLRKEKGFEYLIEAFKKLIKNEIYSKKLKLFILGDGEYRNVLQELSSSIKKNVFFAGFVTGIDKQAFLMSTDIYCMPSIEETFGISLFDPMYFGKPIVATTVGGISEVIEHRKHGLLLPPKSAEKLYEALRYLIENPCIRSKLGKEAKKRLEDFSITKMTKQYIKLYQEVVD